MPNLALASLDSVPARSAAELAMEPPCAGALSPGAWGPLIANSVRATELGVSVWQ